MVKYTMQPTTATKDRRPAWVTVGIAVREHQAVRFDVITGPASGTYYLSSEDVTEVLEGGIAPVYRFRTQAGERVPVQTGFLTSSQSGRMLIVQLDQAARFMVPALALAAHYANPAANKATKITAPADEMTPAPVGLVSSSFAGAIAA